MDATSAITTADLALDEVGRDLWEPALLHLTSMLSGDATAYLDAFEAAARAAGSTQEIPVKALLDDYSEGATCVHDRVLAGGGAEAEAAARRVLAVEHVALTRIAAGYSSGLGETIERLRRAGRGGVSGRRRHRSDQARASSTSASLSRWSAASAWTSRSACSSSPSTTAETRRRRR